MSTSISRAAPNDMGINEKVQDATTKPVITAQVVAAQTIQGWQLIFRQALAQEAEKIRAQLKEEHKAAVQAKNSPRRIEKVVLLLNVISSVTMLFLALGLYSVYSYAMRLLEKNPSVWKMVKARKSFLKNRASEE